MSQICINSNLFIFYIAITIGIILWSLYMMYQTHLNVITDKFDSYKYYTKLPDVNQPLNPIKYNDNMRMNTHSLELNNARYTQPFIKFQLQPEFQPAINPREPPFMEIGYVQSKKGNKLEKMFKLYGRRNYADKFTYYVMNDANNIKIPVYNKNGWEFNSGDMIDIDGFKDKYIIKLYY